MRAGGTSIGITLVTRDKVVLAGGYGIADVASAPPGLIASVAGIYADYAHVFQLREEPDGSLTLSLKSSRVAEASGISPSARGA